MAGKLLMSNTKRVVIGIVILGIVALCVYISIDILNTADKETSVQTVRLNQLSMFEDTAALNKQRIFYIPILTTKAPPTSTMAPTVPQLNLESSTGRGFVILNNYSDAIN